MEIKDRIKKISKYFKNMQITTSEDGTQIIYVVVEFPTGWIIDDDLEEKFGITVGFDKRTNNYYFCADIDTGEQILFDAIDYNIDKMKEAIERAQLLSAKISELKSMFEDEAITISQLRSLRFEYKIENDAIKDIKPSKKKDKENKEKENKTEINE